MADQPRRWYAESGQGRLDVDGVEWFLTDGYDGWCRWKDGRLITRRRPNFHRPHATCGMR